MTFVSRASAVLVVDAMTAAGCSPYMPSESLTGTWVARGLGTSSPSIFVMSLQRRRVVLGAP